MEVLSGISFEMEALLDRGWSGVSRSAYLELIPPVPCLAGLFAGRVFCGGAARKDVQDYVTDGV